MYYRIDKEIQDLIKNGHLEEALNRLSEIQINDERIMRFLNMKKAHLALNLKKYFLADFYLLLAKEGLDKTNPQYYQILCEEAKLALETQDYDRTFSCCKEAIKTEHANDGIAYLVMGHAYEEQGDYKKSYQNYQMALNKTKSDSVKRASLFSLTTLEYFVGHFDKATGYAEEYAKISGLNNKIINVLACCYFRQGRYKELSELLKEAKDVHLSYDIELDIFLAKALKEPLPNIKSRSYSTRQVQQYQKSAAKTHIKKNHHSERDKKTEFSSDIDIETLLKDIQIQLTDENKGYTDLRDVYDVAYPNAGYDEDGNILNRIRVVTIAGTKNIIAMYPVSFSILKENKALHLQDTGKKLTRIERFNARLAKKENI